MRIGIWNTAFLGDTLLTLPLLQVLRTAYPKASIDFWVRSSYCPLYEEQEGYTTYGYSKKSGLSGLRVLGQKISSMKYSVWINPHPSYRSSYIMRESHAPIRISYTSPCINRLLATHVIERNPHIHEVERLLSLTTPLGIAQQYTLPCYALPPSVEEELVQQGVADDKIAISLAIGAMWKTKRWLPEYFGDLVRRSLDEGYIVYLVGGGSEEEAIAQQVLTHAKVRKGESVISFLNASLPFTAGVLRKSTVCCGNDTGLMHLAWIQNTPTIALYGPTVSEQGFYPLSVGSKALGIELSCRPCGKHGSHQCKKKHFQCMKELSPQYVWQSIQECIVSRESYIRGDTQ